jgi:Fe2+ transport system protein FeoA
MTNLPQAPRPATLIADLPAGSAAVVHSLTGQHGFCSRMANLGFTAGAPVTVRQNYGRGPIVVALRGTLVALGRAEAARIIVLPCEA